MSKHEGLRTRRIRVLLSSGDLEQIGTLLVEERPSVRFMVPRSASVLRTMPTDAPVMVTILDSIISPGLDLPAPDFGNGGESMQVNIITCTVTPDQDMQVGEVNCLLDPARPEHLAFWGAVADGVKAVAKPHVTFLDGASVNVRVGADAEAWWWADDQHGFRDGPYTRYRLREKAR
jgi:hypothetical protein